MNLKICKKSENKPEMVNAPEGLFKVFLLWFLCGFVKKFCLMCLLPICDELAVNVS